MNVIIQKKTTNRCILDLEGLTYKKSSTLFDIITAEQKSSTLFDTITVEQKSSTLFDTITGEQLNQRNATICTKAHPN